MNNKNNISWLIIIPLARSARLELQYPILETRTARSQGAGLSGGSWASSATDPKLIYDKNPADIRCRDQVIQQVGSVRRAVLDHASANPLK